jgi:glutamine synthetase
VRFEGNSYSDAWKKEALKRGLTNVSNVPESLNAYLTEKSIRLFTDLGVLTEREIVARNHVRLDTYTKRVQIESRVLGDLAINHIIPTAIKYQTMLLENVKGLKDVFVEKDFKDLAVGRIELIESIGEHISHIKAKVGEMIEARKLANIIEDEYEKALSYANTVFPFLDEIRYHIDKLELIVDDEIWPLPKYRELLFNR